MWTISSKKKTCELWNDDDLWLWHSTSLISQFTWIYHITCASNKEKWHRQEISRIYPPSLRYSSSWVFVKDMSETTLRISWSLFCKAQFKSSVYPSMVSSKCARNTNSNDSNEYNAIWAFEDSLYSASSLICWSTRRIERYIKITCCIIL